MRMNNLYYVNRWQSYILEFYAFAFNSRFKKMEIADCIDVTTYKISIIKDIKKQRFYIIKIRIGETNVAETERRKETLKRAS